jgi:plastocyanin
VNRGLALGLAALTVAGLAGCSVWGTEGGPGGAGAAAPTATDSVATAVAGSDGVQRIEVTMGDDLRFTPTIVRAHPGIIEFTFRNVGGSPHDVQFADPLSASTGNVNGGDVRTVRVTVERSGTYPYPCAYHVSSGMRGTLEISS